MTHYFLIITLLIIGISNSVMPMTRNIGKKRLALLCSNYIKYRPFGAYYKFLNNQKRSYSADREPIYPPIYPIDMQNQLEAGDIKKLARQAVLLFSVMKRLDEKLKINKFYYVVKSLSLADAKNYRAKITPSDKKELKLYSQTLDAKEESINASLSRIHLSYEILDPKEIDVFEKEFDRCLQLLEKKEMDKIGIDNPIQLNTITICLRAHVSQERFSDLLLKTCAICQKTKTKIKNCKCNPVILKNKKS